MPSQIERLVKARAVLQAVAPTVQERGWQPRLGQGRQKLLSNLAKAMGEHAWAGVMGIPDMGWLAAEQAGIDLSRILVVPSGTGLDAKILATLIDGVDVVALGKISLSVGQQRSLWGRMRARNTVLLTDENWPRMRQVG